MTVYYKQSNRPPASRRKRLSAGNLQHNCHEQSIFNDCCYHNYIYSKMSAKKTWLIGLGVAILGIGALYVRNMLKERNIKPLAVQQTIRILKLIRREKYMLYRKICTLAARITQQMRNNINPKMVEELLNGPDSPIKISQQIDSITEEVCARQNTTIDAYSKALETYKNNEEIIELLRQQNRDFQLSLAGKIPSYNVNIPEHLTKPQFVKIQNKITKNSYLQQVALFKQLTKYTEQEIQLNPGLLAQVPQSDEQQYEILTQANLGSDFEPPFAVYELASVRYRSDPTVKAQIAKIQHTYQKILMKYSLKIQNKSITEQQLNNMEEEIIFAEPLAG